ncbi:hemerythrin-like metal-binding domain protein [Natronincola peptidivorans]|uniref:Hemerythrin-like metal-binding domain protein n=1 Tax=Natronincola peptidivorans TaxID=426128 RepID=A0A1I0DRF2_9FIRM|nr:bacteriohemerythrin [Natronincola peptidivorans]SET34507.1 hemerythrin-like metal-binding domain protein [Natronincola peptidivorans]
MDKVNKIKIIKSISLFLAVIIFGICGFIIIEGWNIIDAAYMTIITLSTVGYGETHQLTNAGRTFTIFLIIFGLGSAASVLNSFATILLENKLNYFMGRRAMNSQLKKMKDHVILSGFGQIGGIIALKLQEKNIPFVVIDENEEEIQKTRQLGFVSVQGSSTSDATLLNAGIKRAKTMVICIPDITINLTLSLAAKELNPNIEVIAQGDDRSLEPRITRAGADVVVYPLALGGEQISEIIAGNYGQEKETAHWNFQPIDGYYIKMYRHFSNEPLTIQEILAKEKGLRAIGYKPKSFEIIDNPSVDIQVNKDDGVIILLNDNIKGEKERKEDDVQTKLEWSEEYSVGIASIDEEHLRLINLINNVNEAIRKGESKTILVNTFDQLIDYSLQHFKNEEQLLRNNNFPELETHILEHQKLMKTVLDLNKEKNYIFPANVSEFLNAWLIEHILSSDRKYKEYFSK